MTEWPIPESYGEMRLDGRHDRRIELRHTSRSDKEGLTARLVMDYGHRRGNFPLDKAAAQELIHMLSRFVIFADLVEHERTAREPGAFAEFYKAMGIESD